MSSHGEESVRCSRRGRDGTVRGDGRTSRGPGRNSAGGGQARANKGPFGIWVPPHVLGCPGLTATDSLVLGQILQLSTEARGCYASVRRLAAGVNCSERTLRRVLERLMQRGLLRRNDDGLRAAEASDPAWTAPAEPAGSVSSGPLGTSGSASGRREPPRRRRASATPDDRNLSRGKSRGRKPAHAGRPAKVPPPPPPDALEQKLLQISGLDKLVGVSTFPAVLFRRCLEALRQLHAQPEELEDFVEWWSEQAVGYRRTYPTLAQIGTMFHLSRESTAMFPRRSGARDRTGGTRGMDGGMDGMEGMDGMDGMEGFDGNRSSGVSAESSTHPAQALRAADGSQTSDVASAAELDGDEEFAQALLNRDPRFQRLVLRQLVVNAHSEGNFALAESRRRHFLTLFPEHAWMVDEIEE